MRVQASLKSYLAVRAQYLQLRLRASDRIFDGTVKLAAKKMIAFEQEFIRAVQRELDKNITLPSYQEIIDILSQFVASELLRGKIAILAAKTPGHDRIIAGTTTHQAALVKIQGENQAHVKAQVQQSAEEKAHEPMRLPTNLQKTGQVSMARTYLAITKLVQTGSFVATGGSQSGEEEQLQADAQQGKYTQADVTQAGELCAEHLRLFNLQPQGKDIDYTDPEAQIVGVKCSTAALEDALQSTFVRTL